MFDRGRGMPMPGKELTDVRKHGINREVLEMALIFSPRRVA
jgi:hypothetical protein